MKRMQAWRWMPAALLLAVGGTAGWAGEFAIQSLDGTGKLVFGSLQGASNYEVRTSSAITGGWSVARSVAPTAANALTTTVSVAGAGGFCKVVAFMNAGSPSDETYLVIDLSAGPSALNYPVNYLSAVPVGGWTDEYKTTKLVMRRIPHGEFTMGSPNGELGHDGDETQHQVTLTKDFYIGVFEVTQKQWERVMGNWPGCFSNVTYRDSRPVEQVSCYDIRENPNNSAISPHWPQSSQVHADSFMGKLRARTGLTTLDLPTESQWEYACRAGTTTALNSGMDLTDRDLCPNMSEVGRYYFNGGSSYDQGCAPSAGTALAGSYRANAWGLYDMHGNVWELCLDWYGVYPGTVVDPPGVASDWCRVSRGGHWYKDARYCRSASRYFIWPDSRFNVLGFRLARTLP